MKLSTLKYLGKLETITPLICLSSFEEGKRWVGFSADDDDNDYWKLVDALDTLERTNRNITKDGRTYYYKDFGLIFYQSMNNIKFIIYQCFKKSTLIFGNDNGFAIFENFLPSIQSNIPPDTEVPIEILPEDFGINVLTNDSFFIFDTGDSVNIPNNPKIELSIKTGNYKIQRVYYQLPQTTLNGIGLFLFD